MKKVMLAALASTVIASSASASFYASLHGGADVGRFMSMPEVTDKVTGLKLDRQLNGKGGVEVGYHVMDNLGLGLAFDIYINPEFKTNSATKTLDSKFLVNVGGSDWEDAKVTNYKKNGFDGFSTDVSYKFSIMSLMAKFRFDLVDFDVAQIYLTGGVGGSYVSGEYSWSVAKADKIAAGTDVTAKPEVPAVAEFKSESIKTKSAMQFPAIAGGLGVAFKVSDSAFLNVGAEYSYMGKIGKEIDGDKAKTDMVTKLAFDADKVDFGAINAFAGIRFNF